MSLLVYKVIHIFGIALLLAALGGACVAALNGLPKESNKARSLIGMSHGLGLALVFIAGFGMLAKLGLGSPANWGGWVWLKIVIWAALAAGLMVQKKQAGFAKAVWIALPILVLLAAWLALYKPF